MKLVCIDYSKLWNLFMCFSSLYYCCMQPIDKQSLLDSGILCCLIHILNALLDPEEAIQHQKAAGHEEPFLSEKDYNGEAGQVRRLEVAFA